MRLARPSRATGFSLIELAVVLVVIGLLVGGGIVALDATQVQMKRSEAKSQLRQVREALYGFAMTHDRLPCPDDPDISTDPDGLENQSGSPPVCESDHGALPWATLGIGRRDPWGNPFYYHVEEAFATGPPSPEPDDWRSFSLADNGATIEISDGEGETIVSNTPAVVASFGGQGGQVWRNSGIDCSAAATQGFSEDEKENCDGDDSLVAASYRNAEAADGRFDDLLIWISDPVLKARMVEARRLPP